MSAPDRAPLLEVRDLRKTFGGVRAVDGVSFSVAPGETVSVIGPNGSGKTTAFNAISGLLRPDGGAVVFSGRSIEGCSPEQIAELGISRTFQNGRVFGNMSVAENVKVGMHARLHAQRPLPALRYLPVAQWASLVGEALVALARPPAARSEEAEVDAEVDRQLARFGERLLPRREHLAHSLSYANRRRTEMARALAPHPKLLLLDEPTAGMNPTETAEVLDQLLELRRQGQTILLIEHKLDLVMALSDRVLVLDGGKLIAQGLPRDVRRDERVVEAYLGRRAAEEAGLAVPAATGEAAVEEVPSVPTSAELAGVTSAEGATDGVRGGVAVAEAPAVAPSPEGAQEPLLRLQDVDAFYGPVQALHGVSIRVDRGEIVCLLGGNASGKSTTMKIILGLLKPRGGDVYLGGERVTDLSTSERIRRGVASVPEARHVFPSMTVEENLRMGAYLRRDAGVGEDLDRMYGLFPRLAERRRQLAGTMSGGEQQMLAMARALMSRPRLICMDEPTMGLAPVVVERVLDLIAEINRTGVTVFMVEQNATLALSIAHRGYVLQSGTLVLEGDARRLAVDPAVREAYLGGRTEAPPTADPGAAM